MWPTAESLFAYPVVAHVRKHGPQGYADYGSFKPWLRDDFDYRCVYCLCREAWFPSGAAAFSVDHLEPQSSAPHRITEYGNLSYSCLICNSFRQDLAVPDPCLVAYGSVLRLRDDGSLDALAPDGKVLIETLRLNAPERTGWRLRMLALLSTLQAPGEDEVGQFQAWFGYPDDLPDLAALRPPGGNTRPEGVAASHHARRLRGELPATY